MDTTRTGSAPDPVSAATAHFAIRYEGHEIEVRADGGEVLAERVDVAVDGETVDPATITARSHDLCFVTDDGVEIRLHVGGRVPGGLARVRLRRPDGYWVDLDERRPGASSAAA